MWTNRSNIKCTGLNDTSKKLKLVNTNLTGKEEKNTEATPKNEEGKKLTMLCGVYVIY